MQKSGRTTFGIRLREGLARLAGRKVSNGHIGPAREGQGFKTFVALMIAVVTILAAVVAWRSALAIAALNGGRASTPQLKAIETEVRDLFRRPMLATEMKRLDGVVFDPPRAGA